MSDYWDILAKSALGGLKGNFWNMNSFFDLYNKAFDNSHGADRYWLTQIPWYSKIRGMYDKAREAQDRYDNTNSDEEYIDRVVGFNGSSLAGDIANSAGRAVRMARSLSGCYPIEVMENVGIDTLMRDRGVA